MNCLFWGSSAVFPLLSYFVLIPLFSEGKSGPWLIGRQAGWEEPCVLISTPFIAEKRDEKRGGYFVHMAGPWHKTRVPLGFINFLELRGNASQKMECKC